MNLNAAPDKDLKVVAFFLATISLVALLTTNNACAPPVDDGAVCGNGIVEAGEKCDPPDGTTCDESCQAITPDLPVCGNGIVEEGEQCEPPNGTTCDESCQTITIPEPPVCGNGIVEAGEVCDPPDGTTCDQSCQAMTPDVPECGNGIVEAGEVCDPPDGTTCDESCHSIEPPVNGDDNNLVVEGLAIQGGGYFGRGYDVSGKYADAIQAKDFVLNVNKMIQAGLVDGRKLNQSSFSTITGKSIEEYQEEMALSANLSGSYGAFSGSVSANFSQSSYSSSSHEFVTIKTAVSKGSVELPGAMTGLQLQDYMDAMAKQNIDDPGYSPQDVFRYYGTHVLTGIITGARMDMNYTADTSTLSTATSFGVEVEAEYKNLVGSISGGSSYSTDESTTLEQINTERRTNVYGGVSEYGQFIQNSNQYERWIDSIDGNEVFCDFMPNGLKPIWEFASTASRQTEIEDAFDDYIANSQVSTIPGGLTSVKYFSSELEWQQTVESQGGEVIQFNTTPENIAKSDEWDVPPRPAEWLGRELNFSGSETFLGFDFHLTNTGCDRVYGLKYDEEDFSKGTGYIYDYDYISIGSASVCENDDFEIGVTSHEGNEVFAIGIFVDDSASESGEALHVYTQDGVELSSFSEDDPEVQLPDNKVPSPDGVFMGVVSPGPLGRIWFDEHSGGDDIRVKNFRFGVR